jgi:hypothetical protein
MLFVDLWMVRLWQVSWIESLSRNGGGAGGGDRERETGRDNHSSKADDDVD